MSSLIARLSAGLALAVALAPAGAAYAGDKGGNPPGAFDASPTSQSSQGFSASQTTTHTTPGTQGSQSTGSAPSTAGSGSATGSSSSSYVSPSSIFGPTAGIGGLGACDPASYGPGGYSSTLALPAPCKQPTPAKPGKPGKKAAAPVVTTQMVTAAAVVTAPAAPPHVEPGTVSYVNIPNNYWAGSDVVRDSVTLLGQTIPLVWTPTRTTWDFGDGSTAEGEGVEGADVGSAAAVEHAYDRQGTYAISTTTTYDLTFVLPGQGAQTVSLTAPPSPAVNLPVREVQTLVSYVS